MVSGSPLIKVCNLLIWGILVDIDCGWPLDLRCRRYKGWSALRKRDPIMIPSVPVENLHAALTRFDRELRYTQDWASWESNNAHLYAIEHEGKRYPVKQIVSMA